MAYGNILGQSVANSPTLNNYFTKQETLTDDTAALYGLGPNANPDQIFSANKNLINSMQELLNSSALITSGSYVGTGTYGINNPTTIVTGFPVKFIFIVDFDRVLLACPSSEEYSLGKTVGIGGGSFLTEELYSKQNSNGISIYYNYEVSWQMNRARTTYSYVAFG